MPQNEASTLRVEGTDDKHAMLHLLGRHGVDCQSISVETAGGQDRLLEEMSVAVKASTGLSVGFVLDADETPQDRWRAVCNRLKEVGLALPEEIPSEGFVGEAHDYHARVGIWLMPDNQRSGALEEFLQDLVDSDDLLLPIAEESTHRAKEQGAPFSDSKQRKAVLHAWLAWQARPGLPYGSAIAARYFGHDSVAALAFVDWFKRVFVST